MTQRVSCDLLLVGSVPAASTEEALRAGAANFADLVCALPDGETGPRSSWVGYERERLVRPNPAIETVSETDSPTGIPRHMYETPVFRIRPGRAAGEDGVITGGDEAASPRWTSSRTDSASA